MAKAIGSPKTGGRKKGTPNKRTLAFSEILDARGIDLVSEILDAARRLPAHDRIGIYISLLPYQYPKRKPSEGPAAPTSLADHLNQLNRDQLQEVRNEVVTRLGLDKNYDQMSPDARADYDRMIEELKRMIRAEEELGTGPD